MDRLAPYRTKRDFAVTAEPAGKPRRRAAKAPATAQATGGRFVMHEHAARRLHYDLRLEHDGVLLSWAVTRGPSLNPHDKRLAVQVEDHPLDYGSFEGTIPKGEYGGGTVVLWDRGTWQPEGPVDAALAKGHLSFTLQGEKLTGGWHLVRLKPRKGERRANWLLIKAEDAAARAGAAAAITRQARRSVASGRTLQELAEGAPPAETVDKDKTPPRTARRPRSRAATTPEPTARRGGRSSAAPDFVPPALAQLGPTPSGPQWLHEVKFDGYRLQALIGGGVARLLTRSGQDWTPRFGNALRQALEALPCRSAALDGEVVVPDATGLADFGQLQADLAEGRHARMVYYVFDLLWLDGRDLRARPLVERKAKLAALLQQAAGPERRLRFSEDFPESEGRLLEHACRLGLEGLVSKRRQSRYRSGRNGDWVKSKCTLRQEFVVAGYQPSDTARGGLGSLLLGYWQDGRLHHAGRVGTGFATRTATALKRRLDRLRQAASPFADHREKGIVWVQPTLVAEVAFRAWTAGGLLRQAAFIGLREDKPAAEVVRETAPDATGSGRQHAVQSTTPLTHPDRLLWPQAGVTKQGLLDYYAMVWPLMRRFVVGRPLSLLRAPDGLAGESFFQKHVSRGMPARLGRFADPADDKGLISIADFDDLAALVQFGVVEIHLWGCTLKDMERPDQLVFDLDPDSGLPWEAVVEAAQEIRQRLKALKLGALLKLTGGKGLHVIAPLRPAADWTQVKSFARDFASALASDFPERFTASMSKRRRHGRIFIDYLRNGRGATAVAPHSTRARPAATVALPVTWEELEQGLRPDQFTVANLGDRLAAKAPDPWRGWAKAARPLPATQPGTKPPKRR